MFLSTLVLKGKVGSSFRLCRLLRNSLRKINAEACPGRKVCHFEWDTTVGRRYSIFQPFIGGYFTADSYPTKDICYLIVSTQVEIKPDALVNFWRSNGYETFKWRTDKVEFPGEGIP